MTVVAVLDLVEIDATDGTFRFWPGQDGTFRDINGNDWIGSSLGSIGNITSSIDGIAPSVDLKLSYYQDPDAPDLIDTLKTQGLDYVKGREVRFYRQDISSYAELSAPVSAPQLFTTRYSSALSFSQDGAVNRTITLTAQSFAENRNQARRIILNTEGHKQILGGVANPSLTYMPETDFEDQPLFE